MDNTAPAMLTTSSASIAPPASATGKRKATQIQIEDWEWLAMMICRLWMDAASDPEIKRLIEMHMNGYDAAKAAGVVSSVNPAREKELRAETSIGKNGYQYIADHIEAWISQFRAGPPAHSYRLPSFTTESEASQNRQPVAFGMSSQGRPPTSINMDFIITPAHVLSALLILSSFRTNEFRLQVCQYHLSIQEQEGSS